LNAALAGAGLFEKEPTKFNRLVAKLASTEAEHMKAEEEWLEIEMLREELEGGGTRQDLRGCLFDGTIRMGCKTTLVFVVNHLAFRPRPAAKSGFFEI